MELSLHTELTQSKKSAGVIGITVFVILMGLGAFVRIPLPFTPVPVTLQTFFVLLSASCLGSNRGVVSQVSYIMAGAAGLPIFSGAGWGLAYLAGPTGGYLAGFVVAAFLVSRSIEKTQTWLQVCILFCLADLVLLSLGTLWLASSLRLSLAKALSIGMLPFLVGDAVKALAAAGMYQAIRVRCKEIF